LPLDPNKNIETCAPYMAKTPYYIGFEILLGIKSHKSMHPAETINYINKVCNKTNVSNGGDLSCQPVKKQ